MPHLEHKSQPVHGFDDWYHAHLDTWYRRVIHASTLKEYLVGIEYTDWDEVCRLIPGIEMENVTKTTRLSQVNKEDEVGASPRATDALVKAGKVERILVNNEFL